MATVKPREQAEAVKNALRTGTASQATSTELQSLLDSKPLPIAPPSKRPQTAPKGTKSAQSRLIQKAKTTDRSSNAASAAGVQKVPWDNLPPREKYALATEIINTGIKILTDSPKLPADAAKSSPPPERESKSTPKTPQKNSTIAQRALQPCSGNTTPVVSNSAKRKPIGKTSPRNTTTKGTKSSPYIIGTAECVRTAFSFLRSASGQHAGAQGMLRFQLENGMLALVTKLIEHGLLSMAIQELRFLKRRLESQFPEQKSPRLAKKTPAGGHDLQEKDETLASLMHLRVSFDPDVEPETLAIAINYYRHVLKIIATSRKPAVIEDVVPNLRIDTPNSVVDLILRHADLSKDPAKAAKQLELLYQTILSLCPSVLASADDAAKDSKQCPSPGTVIGLQFLALRIRRLSWNLSNYQADLSKELVPPFWNCVKAFLRRNSVTGGTMSISGAIRSLSMGDAPPSLFDDESLDPAARGLFLEWQFNHAVELASKTPYHESLRKIIPNLLGRLSSVYVAAEFPIRRARIAIATFRLRETHPELVPPHTFQLWRDATLPSELDLARDADMQIRLAGAKAELDVTRAFSDGQPSVNDLYPALTAWERIVDNSVDSNNLRQQVESPKSLLQQLGSITAYLSMLGEDAVCLATQRLLFRLVRLLNSDDPRACLALVKLAEQYLQLGYAEKTYVNLEEARCVLERRQQAPDLVTLQYRIVDAEYLLTMDKMDECRMALDLARHLLSELSKARKSEDERKTYRLLHAQFSLVQSKYWLETASPHDSLAAAKRAVMILSNIWVSLERSMNNAETNIAPDIDEPNETAITGLTKGISKLQLTPDDGRQSSTKGEQNKKGAIFWTVVPLLCKSLAHLSDIYAHHGLFRESSYHSERAIQIAESVRASTRLSRLRSHRSRLLTLANRTEGASLCLAQGDTESADDTSLAAVERCCAKAGVCEKDGSLEEAATLYEKAESMIRRLGTDSVLEKLERFGDAVEALERRVASMCLVDRDEAKINCENSEHQETTRNRKVALKRNAPQRRNGKKASQTTPTAKSDSMLETTERSCYPLQKLEADIALRKALVKVRSGQDIQSILHEIDKLRSSTSLSLRRRVAHHWELMRRAIAALGMDVTFNILVESTLSYPATASSNLDQCERGSLTSENASVADSSVTMVKSKARTTRKEAKGEERFADLVNAARESLLKNLWTSIQTSGTMQTHAECMLLLNATLLLSAISRSEKIMVLDPINDSLVIDVPRVKALEYEQRAIALHEPQADLQESVVWSANAGDKASPQTLTAAAFRENFIDILPSSWTAVTLCLSEDASELYVARYHCGQTPLLLRLPLSRKGTEAVDEEAFDYYKGKAELQEIIDCSNYTCHNHAKGAHNKWWAEREALDRRMHELLLNIENIWIGGFKGVFSQHPRHSESKARFCKAFEDILNRHLPSRNASKAQTDKLPIDDEVLELFIGLGHDQDGTVDLDETLADLAYFVVETLQFNGERNAYDEVDFDSITVEMLDALRSYHDGCANDERDAQHLILVLEKRLQCFPWESLPCLQGANVSRVGSMLSLRERILAMRAAQRGSSENAEERHLVKRTSGTYILNPSSDLQATQAMLEPMLSKLSQNQTEPWTAIVNEAPDESSFASALNDSSILLYFGHGGGSQYIRPKTIKRLNRCSEVVWLMGCSSGAVYEFGEFEPEAVPLAYLLAGQSLQVDSSEAVNNCKAVVATLWDVTDRDIDRFSVALGEEWDLWRAPEDSKLPVKTPRTRHVLEAPCTPQQPPKTPKTPKSHKSRVPPKTPVRDYRISCGDASQKRSLVAAVSRSRDVCKLRYLNGAAPVVYGIPVYLED